MKLALVHVQQQTSVGSVKIWVKSDLGSLHSAVVQPLVMLKQNPHRSEPEFLSSIKICKSVCEQTLHHFSVRALPIWNGLKAWSDGFEIQKQINRGDPREILLWYPGLQPGNAPISLHVTCNTGFFLSGWMLTSLWLSADPSGFLWCVTSQRQCVIFPVRTSGWLHDSTSAPQVLEIRRCRQFVVLNTDICI